MDHRITSKSKEDNSKSNHDKTHDSHSSYYAVKLSEFLQTFANARSIKYKNFITGKYERTTS